MSFTSLEILLSTTDPHSHLLCGYKFHKCHVHWRINIQGYPLNTEPTLVRTLRIAQCNIYAYYYNQISRAISKLLLEVQWRENRVAWLSPKNFTFDVTIRKRRSMRKRVTHFRWLQRIFMSLRVVYASEQTSVPDFLPIYSWIFFL